MLERADSKWVWLRHPSSFAGSREGDDFVSAERQRNARPRARTVDLAASGLLLFFLLIWQFRVLGTLQPVSCLISVAFVACSYALGTSIGRLTGAAVIAVGGAPTRMLIGILTFSTALFVMTLVSPFGVAANASGIAILSLLLLFVPYRKGAGAETEGGTKFPELLCIALAGVGATIWCQDIQPPMVVAGDVAVFHAWSDMFIHVREISAFAQSHGLGSLSNMKEAGAPAQAYHFASYMIPAAMSASSGMSAVDCYAAIQLPLGILVSGLGAYALIASFWGAWPGAAAVFAIVILPDAFLQGFGNRYMSFYFLSQVNLASLYGLTMAALAWAFVIDGCRKGCYSCVLLGYVLLVGCLFYKAQFFVANAFILMIYPCLFFSTLGPRVRAGVGVLFTVLFFVAIGLSQQFDGVPAMRLDGSGIGYYARAIISAYEPGSARDFFERVLLREQHSASVTAIVAALMIAMTTFGIWLFATPAVAILLRKRLSRPIGGFLFLVVGNYFIMSLGLALNTSDTGTPDELLNRPLVWAYFVVAAWTLGGFVYWLQINGQLQKTGVRLLAILVLTFGTIGAVVQARDLQTLPAWGRKNYADFNAVPLCLVHSVRYVRDHSSQRDVIQDSANDSDFVVSALSERQDYVVKGVFGRATRSQSRRLQELATLRSSGDGEALTRYALAHGIDWYVMRPDMALLWPASFLARSAYTCDGYFVFRFEH